MKLIFFLVAFFLVSIRIYFSWSGKDREKRGISESSMVIKGDHFYEELKYAGKFILTEDESGFQSMSPGAHLKFILNDTVVKAESNLQGKIDYRIYDGKQYLQPEDSLAKRMITTTIHQMIYWGFDAESRLERVYKRGGVPALLIEVGSMKLDNLKSMYLARSLSADSLTQEYWPGIIHKIGTLGSDRDKVLLLDKISSEDMTHSPIADAYFSVLSGMQSDMDRLTAIQHLIDQQNLSDSSRLKMISITEALGSDDDKKNLYSKMIKNHLIDSICYDTLLIRISNLGSDIDKSGLYSQLIDEQTLLERQWAPLILQVSALGSDPDKADLLMRIAKKIPGTVSLRETYLTAAKTIHDDYQYGRTLRAIQ